MRMLPLLLLLGVIVLGAALLGRHVPFEVLGARLEGSGPAGLVLFLALGVFGTAVGLPRQGLAFVGGLAWGVGSGLALSLLAAVGGCALCASVASRVLRERIRARHPRFVATLARLLEHDAFAKIVVLRIQPLGTNLLTNLCVGLTPMPLATFLVASAVGYVPQMLVFALLGAGVRVGSNAQLLLAGVLLVLSVVMGGVLYRRHLAREGA